MCRSNPSILHCGLDKMAYISQTTFSEYFYWDEMIVFWFKCDWILFLRVQWTLSSIGSGNGLVLSRWQAIIWTNDDPVPWRIHASPNLSVFWGLSPYSGLILDLSPTNEMALLCNNVSHWLSANLESALVWYLIIWAAHPCWFWPLGAFVHRYIRKSA